MSAARFPEPFRTTDEYGHTNQKVPEVKVEHEKFSKNADLSGRCGLKECGLKRKVTVLYLYITWHVIIIKKKNSETNETAMIYPLRLDLSTEKPNDTSHDWLYVHGSRLMADSRPLEKLFSIKMNTDVTDSHVKRCYSE